MAHPIVADFTLPNPTGAAVDFMFDAAPVAYPLQVVADVINSVVVRRILVLHDREAAAVKYHGLIIPLGSQLYADPTLYAYVGTFVYETVRHAVFVSKSPAPDAVLQTRRPVQI